MRLIYVAVPANSKRLPSGSRTMKVRAPHGSRLQRGGKNIDCRPTGEFSVNSGGDVGRQLPTLIGAAPGQLLVT
jgi:hypothetical protein